MKAIIIDDKDCDALLDLLKLEKLEAPTRQQIELLIRRGTDGDWPLDMTAKSMSEEIHRIFHYRVTKWLQEQGYRSQR